MNKLKELSDKSIETYEWNYSGVKPGGLVSQRDWNQTLIAKINEASNIIRKYNINKSNEDFWPLVLVCSLEACVVLDDIEYFFISPGEDTVGQMSEMTEKVGFLSNTGDETKARFIVYKNPYLPAGKILLVQREDFQSDISSDCITTTVNIIGLP